MLVKSPLAPLFPPGQAPPRKGSCPGGRPYGPEAKEEYKGPFVLLEPVTEGLPSANIFPCLHVAFLIYVIPNSMIIPLTQFLFPGGRGEVKG